MRASVVIQLVESVRETHALVTDILEEVKVAVRSCRWLLQRVVQAGSVEEHRSNPGGLVMNPFSTEWMPGDVLVFAECSIPEGALGVDVAEKWARTSGVLSACELVVSIGRPCGQEVVRMAKGMILAHEFVPGESINETGRLTMESGVTA